MTKVFRSVLTRTLTPKQALAENIQRLAEVATSESLRTNAAAPRINEDGDAPPAQSISDFNAGVRAANRHEDLVVAGADTARDVAPAAPNFNASVLNFLKKGFSR